MAVSADDVRHIAALSRLGLTDARAETLVGELNRILEHMDILQRVDIQGASLDPDATHGLPTRDDVHAPIPLHRERADFAPAMRDGFFLVPRLATHGEAGSAADDEGEG